LTDTAASSELQKIAEVIVSGHSCLLEEITVRRAGRRLLVQVIVDNENGLDLDVVARISRELDREIEARELFAEKSFTLEVSSPGIDRPLVLPRHFKSNIDRLVKFELVTGATFTARISGVDEDSLHFSDHDSVLLVEITSGQVQIEFNRKTTAAADDVVEDDELNEDIDGDEETN
jgi:ribosome maturation factor RimP